MGVSGCGKSSVGQAFADGIGATFLEGDRLHPPENVEKMSTGIPLNDDDRKPWLMTISNTIATHELPLVVACSVLKRAYRDTVREQAGIPLQFFHLSGSYQLIAERMEKRQHHYMPLSLLDSQFQILEPPEPDERVKTIDINESVESIVEDLLEQYNQRLR